MYLMMAVIDDPDKVIFILDSFYEIGINGSTVIDSIGMAHLVADRVPLFARFADLGVKERYNRTIFSVVKDKEQLDAAVGTIEHIVGNLSEPETGVVFALPVEYCRGLDKSYHE